MKNIVPSELGIVLKKDTPVVSSRKVSEIFEREHRDVLESIRSAISIIIKFDAEFSATNFIELRP